MSNQCSNNKHSNRMDSNYTSPYQSAQTSPSSSLATSDSYQSVIQRSDGNARTLPSHHHLADLADPCIKLIQTSASSHSLDKFARLTGGLNVFHGSSGDLTDFQSLPPSMHYSMEQCTARPLVHTLEDLEKCLQQSAPPTTTASTSPDRTTPKALTSEDFVFQQASVQQQRSAALSLIDGILGHRFSQSTVQDTNPFNTQQQQQLKTPIHSSEKQNSHSSSSSSLHHRANTLSPNGSTINEAVAIFNSASRRKEEEHQIAATKPQPQQQTALPSSSVSSNNLTKLQESSSLSSSKKISTNSSSMSPSKSTSALSHFQQSGQIKNLPSSSQEFSRGLTSGNSNEKKQQQQAKEKKSEVAKPEAKKEDNSSKDKSEKKEKKQSKSNKSEEIESSSKKSANKTANSSTASSHKLTSNASDVKKTTLDANKEQRPTSTTKQQHQQQTPSKVKKDKRKQQQQQQTQSSDPAEDKRQSQDAASAKKSAQAKSKSSGGKTMSSEATAEQAKTANVKSEVNLIKLLAKKIDEKKEPSSSTRGSKHQPKSSQTKPAVVKTKPPVDNVAPPAAAPERLKYSREFLFKIRDERDHFISQISPDVFKAYAYCMSGKYWNPEIYFDIVQYDGAYDKLPSKKTTAYAGNNNHNNNINQLQYKYFNNNANANRKYQNNANKNQSPPDLQVPRNSPKGVSEPSTQQQQQKQQQSDIMALLSGSGNMHANPDQVLLGMLKYSTGQSQMCHGLDNYLSSSSYKKPQPSSIENILKNSNADHHVPKALNHQPPLILTAQELEFLQLSEQKPQQRPVPDHSSNAYSQLLNNLSNHPLNTPPLTKSLADKHHSSSIKPSREAESSTMLKQMLNINNPIEPEKHVHHYHHHHHHTYKQPTQPKSMTSSSSSRFPASNPTESPFQLQPHQQPIMTEMPIRMNSLQARVHQRQEEEHVHFSSLMNKLSVQAPVMPEPVADNILRWFPNAASHLSY